ncbi:MAG: M43 family zinc metalloprotease [Bacteroidetes bacterium]|nr:M43 family zinc metalloprotease [Bacteroidota bacterium]
MRKYLLLLFVSVFVVSAGTSLAQKPKRCGTMDYLARQMAEDPTLASKMADIEKMTHEFETQSAGMRTSSTVITIPVVFHVLYHTTAQNISDLKILDQIATLNKDYAYLNADTVNTPAAFRPVAANTNIQFCLATQDPNGDPTTGIIRKYITATGFDPYTNQNIKYTAQGGDDAWDRNKYLNIWTSNFTGASTQIIGISQFPGGAAATDGCVILYGTIGGETYHGTTAYYNLGRTATHEIGHWLNLYHIWGDDGGACNGSDYVTDTPNQASENYSCVAFPHITCNNGPNGDMYVNYMDYGDDNCLNMFTAGQGTRMTAALNGPRISIKTSPGCQEPTGINSTARQFAVSIYPNPSTGEFVLTSKLKDLSDVEVIVTNILGEVVYKNSSKGISYLVQTIDLSDQSNGIYMVEVRTNSGMSTQKVVLNR